MKLGSKGCLIWMIVAKDQLRDSCVHGEDNREPLVEGVVDYTCAMLRRVCAGDQGAAHGNTNIVSR